VRHQRDDQVGHQQLPRHGLRVPPQCEVNSNDFFSIRQGAGETGSQNQNDFGGNLGGPIVKGRAFFFGDVEATKLTQGVTRVTLGADSGSAGGIMRASEIR